MLAVSHRIYLNLIHKIEECFLKLELYVHASYYNLVLLKISNKVSNTHFFYGKVCWASCEFVPLEEGVFLFL